MFFQLPASNLTNAAIDQTQVTQGLDTIKAAISHWCSAPLKTGHMGPCLR
jgi:hypothetical protein